jgi:hypothetical protein
MTFVNCRSHNPKMGCKVSFDLCRTVCAAEFGSSARNDSFVSTADTILLL